MADTGQCGRPRSTGLDELYRGYADWLRRRLRRHVGADQAADLVQETYVRLAPYAPGDIRHPKALLLRIATNLLRDGRRREAVQSAWLAGAVHATATPGDQAEAMQLKQILQSMPPLYRDVFVLSRFRGMTYADIARLQGVSVKTVEWRMSKALDHCLKRLDD
nr:RNA polymerase sigma factor [Brevundimonas diminuta]